MSNMSVTSKKQGNFEVVYIKNAICYFANIHKPKKIYQKNPADKNPSENEYSITLFFDEACKDKLDDEIKLNKQISLVGKDKNKKKAIKFPLSSQVEEGKTNYDLVEGLYGFQISLKELNKEGKPNQMIVLDANGQPLAENVGNGSRVTVKLFGYRNQEDLLNVSLNVVVVNELVAYEGFDGTITDDELGISYEVPKRAEAVVTEKSEDVSEPTFNEDDF